MSDPLHEPLAEVVRIDHVFSHSDPNTKNIELVVIGQRQLVVQKGQFREGDYGVLILPGAVVPHSEPFRFIWEPYSEHIVAPKALYGVIDIHTVVPAPTRRRRIASRKFRKAWSEGLLIPANEFWELGQCNTDLSQLVGADVSGLLSITKYVPEVETKKAVPKIKKKYPRTLKGWLYLITYKSGFRRPEPFVQRVPSYILPFFFSR